MSAMESILDRSINLLIDIAPKLANLSKNEREEYRSKIEETYRLFDEVIVVMMNRLGTIKSISDDNIDEFFKQLLLLNSIEEWVRVERDVRLCKPISDAMREMDSILPKLKAKLSLKDDQKVYDLFAIMATGRGSFADYITESIEYLVAMSQSKLPSRDNFLEMRDLVNKKYKELGQKRRELITAELEMYKFI